MKPLMLFVTLLFSCQLSAQQYHVTLRPHFNGEESSPLWDDSTCSSMPGQNTPQIHKQDFLAIDWTSGGCEYKVRHLFRFADLTNTAIIPAGAQIISATLRLYGEAPGTGDHNYGNSYYPGSPYANTNVTWIYELTDSFDMQTVTWNTQPDVKHTDSVAVPLSTSQWDGMISLDMTNLVKDELMNGNTGFKMMLEKEGYYRQRLFASSYYTDSTYHPALDIVYTPALGIKSVTNAEPDISIYPNPVTTQANLELTLTEASKFTIKIYNMTGILIQSTTVSFNKGINYYALSTAKWPEGIYILKLSDSQHVIEKKIIKK